MKAKCKWVSLKDLKPKFTGSIGFIEGCYILPVHPVNIVLLQISAWDISRHYAEIVKQITYDLRNTPQMRSYTKRMNFFRSGE